MDEKTFLVRATTQWLVRPSDFPTIRCHGRSCPSPQYRSAAHFVQTSTPTQLERVHGRCIQATMLDGVDYDAAALKRKLLVDARLAHRNDPAHDGTDAWTLEMSPVTLPKADILHVSVHFAQRIPIRLSTLLGTGLGLSRAEVAEGIAEGRICSQRTLTGRCAQDFSFVFRWRPAAMTTDSTRAWQSVPSQTTCARARVARRSRDHRQPRPHHGYRGVRRWRRTAAPRP